VDEAQRLREIVLDSLDQEQDANGFARHAYRSRTQFYRVFRAMIEETPVAMRRRLLLERAAWQLSRTQLSVTDISLDANYGSLEAFTRAFRNAFGVSPSSIAAWGRRTLTSTQRMEFTTVPVRMTRKELVDLWISLTSSLARSPGIRDVFSIWRRR
jgi:AraC family transcriptional regulator